MARKKEFDPKRALAKAMGVFWRLGYENASTELLMKANDLKQVMLKIDQKLSYTTNSFTILIDHKANATISDFVARKIRRRLLPRRGLPSSCSASRPKPANDTNAGASY